MLRSRAITRISSLILCCFSLASAGLDEIDTEELEKLLKVPASLNITVSQDAEGVEAGSTPSLLCRLSEPGYILWSVQGKNFSTNESKIQERFDIKQASRNDSGEYTCMAQTNSGEFLNKTINIRVIEPGKVVSGENVRVEVTKPGVLSCDIYGYPVSNFSWQKGNDTESNERLKNMTQVTPVNETHVKLSLHFKSVTRKDNGTYECKARDYNGPLYGHSHLFVLDAPQINIDFIKAIGAGSIYLNWTVNDGNEPILEYYLQHMKKSTGQWQYYSERIGVGNTSYVLKGFESNASYQIKIGARNKIGKSHVSSAQQWVTTLDEDPEFIPKVSVNGVSDISITLRWTVPAPPLREYVHYYTLMMTHGNEKKEAVHPAQQDALYAFEGLSPATTYNFKIAACSEYTKQCGNWSAEVNGTTIDGVPSAPLHISVVCHFDNISNSGIVSATWLPPANPKGQIIRYDIQLAGHSRYRNEFGEMFSESMPLVNKSIDVKSCCNAWLNRKPSNTNYTFSVNGVTRTRSPGKKATGNCTMPATIPDRDSLNQRTWYKIESEGRSYFKLLLPRISERTGPICCYRIFMVRLPSRKTVAELPPPEELNVFSYEFARTSPLVGAYVAEMFDSDQLVEEFLLGNGKSYNRSTACERCIGLRPRAVPVLRMFPVNLTPSPVPPPIDGSTDTAAVPITDAPTTTSPVPMTTIDATTTVSSTEEGDAAVLAHRKRREVPRGMIEDEQSDSAPFPPHDGFLVEGSNYTGFVEIIVLGNGENQFLPAYSNYLTPLYAGLDPRDVNPDDDAPLGVIMHIMIALTVVIVILIGVLCILHRYTKRMQLQRGEEVITLRNSFRHLCRSLRGRHQLVTASPPDMPPIPKVDLLQAYIERHRDSDYGFQHEFELLPDKFTDRTTRASESRENLYKNRYPDIKCYDQTRVRLAQMDGICGSDYINANFVLGYKERKKFICAQGPMENTVCDYWRMIWEQHLELVLMLTNLEEYSKTKCAKYWPDKGETKNFGDITVEHVRERPYSDYVVRELKMTRTSERDVRTIVQYHFLVWKDFMAPEHPHAILRFVKRVNEAYSMEKGPILVHCSAGVGRTGTLVALDSLLQQLAEEGQVSIFNTVCDLRHQRNFLVQSLKQYIFIYRALMEMAQYGDTEIPATQLKAAVERLRQRDNGKEKCRMEEEYDKINSVLEDHKSFSVGGGDENRIKNRNDFVIPYDRNRVILTPVPGREHSTYINASFIEGYDNYESFVITQDPLDGTVADFWRMMSEQCVSTIVMLSDLSDGPRKCPRYWPDDEMSYDHIRVRYIQSESCPYYTRRELSVTNTKTDESTVVTHYQYHGWPTVDGEVPEVTRGLIELVDQTLSKDTESGGPLVVHCNSGSDRSSMFVALSILVQQLRTERRVDIFTTTKKLRSQRHGMISTFVQYEFLHRAIVNYSDLHNLADEEPPSS